MPAFLRALRDKAGDTLLVLPGVAGVVLDDQGRVLLIRQTRDGRWGLPGGCVEPDETPEHAVKREVHEETGLVVDISALLGVGGGPDYRILYADGDTSWVSAVFECRAVGGELRADGAEASEAQFFTTDELAELDVSRIARAELEVAFASPFWTSKHPAPTGRDGWRA